MYYIFFLKTNISHVLLPFVALLVGLGLDLVGPLLGFGKLLPRPAERLTVFTKGVFLFGDLGPVEHDKEHVGRQRALGSVALGARAPLLAGGLPGALGSGLLGDGLLLGTLGTGHGLYVKMMV
jgi:hypothetical protein